MLMAWFVVSNRCALAVALSPAGGAAELHKCCAVKSAGGEEQSPEKRSGECCQALGLLPLETAAKLVKAPDTIPLFDLAWSYLVALVVDDGNEKIEQASGPPEARSFAEVVLQRSMRSHAPPFVS